MIQKKFKKFMEQIDIAIIGAGILGLAIAAETTKEYENVFVFEKNEKFGQETSSRNSEVIHAGIYYPKDSLKAKLCVKGKEIIYQLDENLVSYKKLGKLIVAINENEIQDLENIIKNASENNILDLKILGKKEINKIEPNINAVAAIYSPSTGIVDSHKLMKYFIAQAKSNFGMNPIFYNSEVIGIDKVKEGYKVTITQPNNIKETFLTRILINSTGLQADKIAEIAGINVDSARYRLHFCKGEYFSINFRYNKKTNHLIYPIPTNIDLGIHSVLGFDKSLKLGPNAFYVNDINYNVDISRQKEFYDSAKRYLPFLEFDDLSPHMAGIRPKLQTRNEDFRDFVIKEESDKGFPGLINLIGIESPGLTAAPAIGKHVNKIVKEIF